MGILFTYLFQITYFVACLTLDTKRIDDKRDGMFCWIKHKNFKPNSFSQRNWMQEYFEKFGNFLKLRISKVMVIGISLVITAFGIWGNVKVEIAFDYVKFLPESSNLAQWYQIHQNYFPLDGYRGEIYVANSNLKGYVLVYVGKLVIILLISDCELLMIACSKVCKYVMIFFNYLSF